MSSNAEFIDKLLDNWINKDGTTGTTFAAFGAAAADVAADVAAAAKLKADLKKLYLVFHYPQYTDTTPTSTSTEFLGLSPNATDRVFNYVYNPDYTNTTTGGGDNKVLLSKKGITKANMVTLKMLLDSIVTAADAVAIKGILNKQETSNVITDSPTLGGNNTKTGGKGKNKSSKRVKKHPRRRNKSSKSLI